MKQLQAAHVETHKHLSSVCVCLCVCVELIPVRGRTVCYRGRTQNVPHSRSDDEEDEDEDDVSFISSPFMLWFALLL